MPGATKKPMPIRERFKKHARKIVFAGTIGAGLLGGHQLGRTFEAGTREATPRIELERLRGLEERLPTPTANDLRTVLTGEEYERIEEIINGKSDYLSYRGDTTLAKKFQRISKKGEPPAVFLWNTTPDQLYQLLTPAERTEWEGYVKKHQQAFQAFAQKCREKIPAEVEWNAKFIKNFGRGLGGITSAGLFFFVVRGILRRRKLYPTNLEKKSLWEL